MFNYERTLDVLRDFKHFNSKKRRKIIANLFFDDDFIEWLFQPSDIPNLAEIVGDFYVEFTKPQCMQAMIDCIDYNGIHEFDRSIATFLTTVANIAIQNNNDVLKELEIARRSGDISRKESNSAVAKIDSINGLVATLLKRSRKIIKRDAVRLSRESRLPRYITISALTSIPDPKYIDNFKIGYYLNNLFSTIYNDVERNGEFEDTVKWRVFFKEIFGKENVVEVATFILLEGVHRVNKYENSRDVKECWDTLTTFALNELNDAPTQLRNQMIELYIKRLDKMFSNKAFDLRVNLLKINDDLFPKLAGTINKYADKIVKILDK